MSISCGDVAPIKEPLSALVVKYMYVSYLPYSIHWSRTKANISDQN